MEEQTKNQKEYPTNQWAEWAQYVRNLKEELARLMLKRKIWRTFVDVLQNSSPSESTYLVCEWINLNYVDSILIGLRRMLDDRKGKVSLIRFLQELKRDVSLLSFDRYLTLWTDSATEVNRRRASEAYRRFSSDGRNFDPDVIDSDISKLNNNYEKIIDFTNENITHKQKGENISAVDDDNSDITYNQVHDALDEIAEILNSYILLLTASEVIFDPILPLGDDKPFVRMIKED